METYRKSLCSARGFAVIFTGPPCARTVEKARQLAETLAVNVVKHGWLIDKRGNQVAMAMRWLQGAPFTEQQWRSRDETLVQWSFGTAYSEWSIGAVEIARVAAERDGDTEVAAKAKEIQRTWRKQRHRPAPTYPHLSGMDRFGEWDATAWSPRAAPTPK